MKEVYLSDLTDDKINFIKKYQLKLSEDMRWYSDHNQSLARVYFKHQFLVQNGIL